VSRPLLFFGGNGHCTARLDGARAAMRRLAEAGTIEGVEIIEVQYPGFEGRPSARDGRDFLEAVAGSVSAVAREGAAAYATGIGALFAVTLRAQGRLAVPLVLQGPVLWGLERRWLPRLARRGLAPLIPRLLASPLFQRRFLRRHFTTALPTATASAFFDGYARCAATADLFRWCGPAWLREMERGLAARGDLLSDVEVWWGGRDAVVGPGELRPPPGLPAKPGLERTFARWGHYPMIDDPGGWVCAVASFGERAGPVMIDG